MRQQGEVARFITAEKAIYAKWSKRANATPKEPKIAPPNLCGDCGQPCEKWQHRCDPCKEARKIVVDLGKRQTESYKRSRRAAKARRRAIERGLDAERFDPFDIFERDRWRCHLCGCKTPKRLRGTYDDRAPELDHIVPLAAGGEHSRINTACACRKCNIAKAGKPMGQMRLVA